VLLVGNTSSFRAGFSRRNGVTAVSGVPGSSVVQDTCCGSDTETAHRRRHFSCANGSCNHSLGVGWFDRNDLVEDVSTSESGSSRCRDRPDRGGRRVPHRGHLGLLVGSLRCRDRPDRRTRRRLSVLADGMSQNETPNSIEGAINASQTRIACLYVTDLSRTFSS